MFFLRVFGGASLAGPDGALSGRAAQRHRLALLALLSASRGRSLSRDKLIGYLWPEYPDARARDLLNESVYVIRKALGKDAILSSADELRLNPEVINADVVAFDGALERGDAQEAVRLYAGPFLDGFFLPNAPEFERWVEAERGRLHREYRRVLEQMAEEGEARGELSTAAEFWYRLLADDPLDSGVVLRTMRVLEATGKRAAALEVATRHAALLQEEFGSEPDPTVVALAGRIRTGPPTGRSPQTLTEELLSEQGPASAPVAADASAARDSLPDSAEPSPRPEPSIRAGAPRHQTRRAMRRRMTVALVLLFVVPLAAVLLFRSGFGTVAPTPDPDRVAVLPFAVHGGEEVAYLGEGLVTLLSINLGGGGLVGADPRAVLRTVPRSGERVLDPEDAAAVAQGVGAGWFVVGDVFEAGEGLRITASLYERKDPRRSRATALAEGPKEDIFRIVDDLTRQLLGGAQVEERRLARLAARTTSSLPALRAYLEGEEAFQGRRKAAALDAFREAVHLDSSFALAHYRLANTAFVADRNDLARDAVDRALRHGRRLSQHERDLLGAMRALLEGRIEDAEQGYRAILAEYPNDVDAWYMLGELLQHRNPFRGRSMAESREAFGRVLALDPENTSAVWHLARAAAQEGDRRALDSLLRRVDPLSSDARRARTLRAFSLGGQAEQAQAIRELAASGDEAVQTAVREVAVLTKNLSGAEKIARLLVAPSRPPRTRAQGHALLAYLAVAQGRIKDAQAEVARLRPLNPDLANTVEGAFAVHPFLRRADLGRAGVVERLLAWRASGKETESGAGPFSVGLVRGGDAIVQPGEVPAIRAFLLGMLSAQEGSAGAALRYAGELDRMTESQDLRSASRRLASLIRASVAAQKGDTAHALTMSNQVGAGAVDGALSGPLSSNGLGRYSQAEWLRGLGRSREAEGWYAALGEEAFTDIIFLAPAHFRLGEIYQQVGQPEQAAEQFRRFVELWKRSDADLKPLVNRARLNLGRAQPSAE